MRDAGRGVEHDGPHTPAPEDGTMLLVDMLLVTGAGVAAGIINTAVGSGSLVTYPILVLVGVPPVAASITNTVGLVPGTILGAWAYRKELAARRAVALRMVPMAAVGALIGGVALLVLPAAAFRIVVPVLVLIAVALVAAQPVIVRRLRPHARTRWVPLAASVLGTSVYGGYFGAAQGVILLAVLGVFLTGGAQEHNGLKNLLAATVNTVAALLFVVLGGTHWLFAACVAVGAMCGAPIGARIAKRLPARFFRALIIAFGLVVSTILIIGLF